MSCMIVSIPFANHFYLLNILQIIAFKNHCCIKRFDRQYMSYNSFYKNGGRKSKDNTIMCEEIRKIVLEDNSLT